MFANSLVALLGLWSFVSPALSDSERASRPAPEWTRDARWYEVVVPCFRNGDSGNDPEGTQPWTAKPTVGQAGSGGHAAHVSDGPYGGDIPGLASRLPYLKDLGVNTLYLSGVFATPSGPKSAPDNLRHVDDALAVAGSLAKVHGETRAPATWKFSASDRLFLDFVKKAHKQGFRVVVEGVFGQAGQDSETGPDVLKHVCAVTQRWMDPDKDGNPADGIDGWAVSDAPKLPLAMLKRWRAQLEKTNPDAVLVGDFRGAPSGRRPGDEFHLVVSNEVGKAIRRFFALSNEGYALGKFLDDLSRLQTTQKAKGPGFTIHPVSGSTIGRLLSGLAPRPDATADARSRPSPYSGAVLERWRLVTVLQHCCRGAPMTYYGDEVGMCGGPGSDARMPMWWNDLSAQGTKPAEYRQDFASLVQLLHDLRRRFAPLRYGDFRVVRLDEKKRILAFSRSMPGDKAIVVMNYGDARQKMTLPVGQPGQLVGIVNPELRPGPPHPLFKDRPAKKDRTTIPRFRLGGSQQFVDQRGELLLSMNPRSVTLLVVRDQSPH